MKNLINFHMKLSLVGVALKVNRYTYVRNKTEHFSYKGGCGVHVSRHLKEVLAQAKDKCISNVLFKTVSFITTDINLVWVQN